MDHEQFKQHMAVLGTVMLLAADEAAAPPSECRHRIKVGINSEQCVCAVCRTVIDESSYYGVLITGEPTSILDLPAVEHPCSPGTDSEPPVALHAQKR